MRESRLLFFIFYLCHNTLPAKLADHPECICNNTVMRCMADDLDLLRDVDGRNVSSLNLSENRIKEIPTGVFGQFVHLRTLLLDGNKIENLTEGSFSGLQTLQILSLRNNRIKNVQHEAFYPLRSLIQLDIAGNQYSHLPLSNVLLLPLIKDISIDAPFCSGSCQLHTNLDCPLREKVEQRKIPTFGNVSGLCFTINCTRCSSSVTNCNECLISRIKTVTSCDVFKNDLTVALRNASNEMQGNVSSHNAGVDLSLSILDRIITLNIFTFILSFMAFSSNVIVVALTFTVRTLRNRKPTFLAGNVAACDLLIGSFLLTVAVNNALNPRSISSLNTWNIVVCPSIILLRSLGMVVEPACLFIMALDRYKSLVHQFNPLKQLKYRYVVAAVLLAWLAAIATVSLTVSFNEQRNFTGYICSRSAPQKSLVSVYLEQAIIAVNSLLFLFSCVLYFRIYRSVKSNNLRVGRKTYIRVSKHIAALILSTFVLWYAPAIAVAIFAQRNNSMKELRTFVMLMSFTTNSAVNPFIYVFRDKKFQATFRMLICGKNRQNRTVVITNKSRETAKTVSNRTAMYCAER